MKGSEEDYNLAMLALAGDTDAWNQLHSRANKILCGYTRKYLQSHPLEDISYEDIISEAYSRVYKKLSTYDGRSRFSTWICGFVAYIVLEERNRYRRRKQIYHEYIYLQASFYSRDPCDIIIETELYRSVWDALERLQPLEAYILENRVIHMQTFSELSKTTCLPVRTVKNYYQSALIKYSKYFHIIHHRKRRFGIKSKKKEDTI